MPKCYRCKAEIDSLKLIETGRMETQVMLSSGGLKVELPNGEKTQVQYEQKEFEQDGMISHFVCPECLEIIASTEERAIAFLKGDPCDHSFVSVVKKDDENWKQTIEMGGMGETIEVPVICEHCEMKAKEIWTFSCYTDMDGKEIN